MTTRLGADEIVAADGAGAVSFPDGINTSLLNGAAVPSALPYKVYTALLSQADVNPPTASILQNTLGGIVILSYSSIGVYMITLANAFPDINKTFFIHEEMAGTGADPFTVMVFPQYNDTNSITLRCFDSSGNPTDSVLQRYCLEIRVYP